MVLVNYPILDMANCPFFLTQNHFNGGSAAPDCSPEVRRVWRGGDAPARSASPIFTSCLSLMRRPDSQKVLNKEHEMSRLFRQITYKHLNDFPYYIINFPTLY